MKRKFPVFLALLFLVGAFALRSSAQTINGSITGTVTDANGAAVPGAKITAVNRENGSTRETLTNDEGFYTLTSLAVGVYSVKVEKQGYSTSNLDNISVTVGTATTGNVKLGVGNITATVEVSDSGALLETTQSQVSKTVTQKQILELPGRNSLNGLALLNPGVLPNQNGRPGSGFAVNGNRTRSNNFTIDGANNNDQSLSIPRQNLPPEAIGEFQIITNTFAAEFGRNAGSYVNQITRSGGNEFHGTGFYTWQGNGLDALSTSQERTFLAQRAAGASEDVALRRARSVTVDNIYGGSVGGPIKKNHTFFFTSFDLQDFRTTVSSVQRAALDATSRNFLQANRTAFASPAAVDFLLRTFPVANDPTPAGPTLAGSTVVARQANGTAVGNVVFLTANRTLNQGLPYGTDFGRLLGKINTKINDKDQLSIRYLIDQFDDPGSPASIQGLELGQRSRNQSFTVNDVYVINSKFVNEARFTYSRRKIRFPENFSSVAGGAQIAVGGTFGALNAGNANFPQFRTDNVYEFTENLSYVSGNHSTKFGYNLLKYDLDNFFAPNSRGFINYADFNAFLNDNSNLIQKAVGDFALKAVTYEHSVFAQDDWRINPDLTLNLGLRYEYVTTPFGFFSNATPDVNNFGPRVGMAYNPKNLFNGRMVLRAGFGISYDQVFQNILLNVSRNFPRAITNSITGQGLAPFNNLNSIAAVNIGPANFTGNPNILDYRYFALNERVRQPMSRQWTVGVQYQLGNDYVLKAEYIGNNGRNLVREVEQNFGFAPPIGNGQRLDPTRGSNLVGQGIANSSFHSGQFTIEKRFSEVTLFGKKFGNSTFNANYTWSAFISEADDVLGGQANRTLPADPRNPGLDKARSGFDQPHRFVLNSVYETPTVFQDNSILSRLLSNWQLSAVSTFADGTPFSVLAATNQLGILPGQISTIQLSQRVGLLNPSARDNSFTIATVTGGVLNVPNPQARYILYPNNSGFTGTLGANTERTGGTINTNLGVVKNIRTFSESQRLQLRMEVFNLYNRRNFTTIPGNTLAATTNPAAFLNLGLTNIGGRGFTFGARYFF